MLGLTIDEIKKNDLTKEKLSLVAFPRHVHA